MNDSSRQAASGKLVHSSLMSFLPEISPQAREDILLANTFAQQVAWSDYDHNIEGDWFRNYWRNLSMLGFDGKAYPGFRRPGPNRESIAAQALAHVGQAGSEAQCELARRSMQALGRDAGALRAFEIRALSKQGGRFQLLPCVLQANGAINMVMLHMEISMKQCSWEALLLQADRQSEVTEARVEVISFHLHGFRDNYRRKVEASVNKRSLKAIRDLKL